MIAANGYGGQRLFILPDLDLVVVATAGDYGGKSQGVTGATALSGCILPGWSHIDAADRATALAVEISVVLNPAATFAIGLLIPVMILAGADDIIK